MTTNSPTPRWPRALQRPAGIGSVAIVVPLVMELLGVIPPSFVFEHGRLVLLSRLVNIPPVPTLLNLARLRQLVPDEARTTP